MISPLLSRNIDLVNALTRLQCVAVSVSMPAETSLLPARGGLAGPAFFPEGLGLSEPALHGSVLPTFMAIGHNFGCVAYRNKIELAGREDDKTTWRNLDRLLLAAEAEPSSCFRTNWFIGLLPGNEQTGRFLRRPNEAYEERCAQLLIEQIKLIRPTAIFILGPEVASRVHRIAPRLSAWRGAKMWAEIDRSNIGHSVHQVELLAAGVTANVAALPHPSFGTANQSRRMSNMAVPATEAEIVRSVIGP